MEMILWGIVIAAVIIACGTGFVVALLVAAQFMNDAFYWGVGRDE